MRFFSNIVIWFRFVSLTHLLNCLRTYLSDKMLWLSYQLWSTDSMLILKNMPPCWFETTHSLCRMIIFVQFGLVVETKRCCRKSFWMSSKIESFRVFINLRETYFIRRENQYPVAKLSTLTRNACLSSSFWLFTFSMES